MYDSTEAFDRCEEELRSFVRNRYFYGKLLDVHHFEAEQSYFNEKRWLLNRMVTGYGVVCGLDVRLTDDEKRLFVGSGLAIDQAGRELVVPERSKAVAVPELPPPPASEGQTTPEKGAQSSGSCCDDDCVYFQVCIRWHECLSNPELVRIGSACEDESAPCTPGAIHERYEIFLREGKADKQDASCEIFDLFSSGRLNYDSLARYVTDSCPKVPRDPYVTLANLCLKRSGDATSSELDVTVRPIVYTNDLLFQLLICALAPAQNRTRAGKY